MCLFLCPTASLSLCSPAESFLEVSPDRRRRAAMLSREVCLLERLSSKVGAVVMISGAGAAWVSGCGRIDGLGVRERTPTDENIRRGSGGAFSAAAWSFAFAAS